MNGITRKNYHDTLRNMQIIPGLASIFFCFLLASMNFIPTPSVHTTIIHPSGWMGVKPMYDEHLRWSSFHLITFQKAIGVTGHSSFDFLVTGTDDSYFTLYQLDKWVVILFSLHFPFFIWTYSIGWHQSCFLSWQLDSFLDCPGSLLFFLEWLVLYPQVCQWPTFFSCFSFGTDLEQQTDHPWFHNWLLPFDFTPVHLWVCLQQHVQFISLCGQVLAAPCEAQHLSNVHQLLSSLIPSEPGDSMNMDLLMAAISSTGTACFFCHNTCHTANACPLLLWTKSDPFAKHIWKHLSLGTPQSITTALNSPKAKNIKYRESLA